MRAILSNAASLFVTCVTTGQGVSTKPKVDFKFHATPNSVKFFELRDRGVLVLTVEASGHLVDVLGYTFSINTVIPRSLKDKQIVLVFRDTQAQNVASLERVTQTLENLAATDLTVHTFANRAFTPNEIRRLSER